MIIKISKVFFVVNILNCLLVHIEIDSGKNPKDKAIETSLTPLNSLPKIYSKKGEATNKEIVTNDENNKYLGNLFLKKIIESSFKLLIDF